MEFLHGKLFILDSRNEIIYSVGKQNNTFDHQEQIKFSGTHHLSTQLEMFEVSTTQVYGVYQNGNDLL